MQTPVVVGDKLWSCDLLGILSCVDTTTGKIHYSERLGKGGQAFTASGVAAGNHLYFANEAGDVFVTSGAGGIYSPNVPVARVIKRSRDIALARTLAQPDTLDFALVQQAFMPEAPPPAPAPVK